jgi:hypothetical protein
MDSLCREMVALKLRAWMVAGGITGSGGMSEQPGEKPCKP